MVVADAYLELDRIDRYLSKNWLDDDFTTGKIYEALRRLADLAAVCPKKEGTGHDRQL